MVIQTPENALRVFKNGEVRCNLCKRRVKKEKCNITFVGDLGKYEDEPGDVWSCKEDCVNGK